MQCSIVVKTRTCLNAWQAGLKMRANGAQVRVETRASRGGLVFWWPDLMALQ